MFSSKIASTIQELLKPIVTPVYYVDQVPAFDQAKNLEGFVCWDIEEIKPYECTEGLGYSAGVIANSIILNHDLAITVYASKLELRNPIETKILDILQPKVSGKRIPLKGYQATNAFIRYVVWQSTTEFPVPKTGQSNAEMSASVLSFKCSISVQES